MSDKIENYRRILEKTVKRHARFQPANGNIRELIENGIKKDDIILAYNALPYQKLNDLIAV